MIHQDDRVPIPLYIGACSMGAGTICLLEAYHMPFPPAVINASHPISHLEAMNAVAALQTCPPTPKYQDQLIISSRTLLWQLLYFKQESAWIISLMYAPGNCG